MTNMDLVADVTFFTIGKKTTICLITLKSGFEIVGSSACVDPANFVKEVGEEWALKDAQNKLEELSGFLLQETMHNGPNDDNGTGQRR